MERWKLKEEGVTANPPDIYLGGERQRGETKGVSPMGRELKP
jgi:hypothetical protein